MKIKLDENLPRALADQLADLGHDADTTPQEGLAGQDDAAVWRAAQEAGRFLITQDLDFSDVRRYRPGTHFGLLLVRLHKPSRRSLITRIRHAFEREDVSTWHRAFVVLTERKIRVRRPQ
jgi:predicted nuclease of predicted toxin-antitoxin system